MKKKRKLSVFIFLILTSLIHPTLMPAANAGVADCLDISSPSSSLTSSTLNISAQFSVRCTNAQIGSTGGGGVYEVTGESFGARCSGPRSLSTGMMGTISCSIPIGGSLGSTRYSATSSTIKVWFAWDFSTKFITINHQAIPSRVVATVPTPTTSQNPLPQQSSTPNPVVIPQPTQKPVTNDQALNEILGLVDSISEQINGLNDELLTKYKLTCKKGTRTKYVTGTKPKCPTGYTQKLKKKIS